jgi:hypothetical protein
VKGIGMSTLADRRRIKRLYRPDQPKFINPTTIYAYHRTKSVRNIHHIMHDKYDPTLALTGQLYGAGLYASYTLKAQQTKRMRTTYGTYLLRVAIDLSNYLILDEPLIVKLGKDSVTAQFAAKGIDLDSPGYSSNLGTWVGYLQFNTKRLFLGTFVSADLAKYIAINYGELTRGHFDGIVFTGRQDGTTIVSYHLPHVRFIDYARYNAGDVASGMQPLWRNWRAEHLPKNGVSFADELISQTQSMSATSLRDARRYFAQRWRRLTINQRHLVFQKLCQITYVPTGKRYFFDWLIGDTPGSNKRFVRWFAPFYGKPPEFNYTVKQLNRFNFAKRSYKLNATKRKHLTVQKVFINQPHWKNLSLTAAQERPYFRWMMYCKMTRLLYGEFQRDWSNGISQFITRAPGKTNVQGVTVFVHYLSELYSTWQDMVVLLFPQRSLGGLNGVSKFMEHALAHRPDIRIKLHHGP